MEPLKELPDGYQLKGSLDLARDRKIMIILNLLGLGLLFLFSILFTWLAYQIRPGANISLVLDISISSLGDVLLVIAAMIAILVIMVVLHEGAHGLVFWLITGQRPHFGFGWSYAYAAAPDWYIPRNQYLVTALAPIVLVSLLGLAVLPFIPNALLPALLLLLTLNAAGAVGDLWVAVWLLMQPPTTLAHDHGTAISLYVPSGTNPVRST